MQGSHAETALFADPTAPRSPGMSARAAYQLALTGRVAILDLRTGREKKHEGALPAYLSGPSTSEVVALVGADGVSLGLPAIVGGFTAWRAAGMPVG